MSASVKNDLRVASITDRGLSEKRPVNEDSLLADPARGIFAVADGVGGAEAGEVASQTAVEVLDEAFRHRVEDGDDVEDLMELAIQRANNSIHRMAIEHPRFSMMATTIVSLHVDGNRATIGHVGDSRLYRISPDGRLHRETTDHSIVEEEVRAGRMTPEQAANHPSKNVISRALGAEESVEVDMKTIEVENGTAFLLCSDGITRHIPDTELRRLLTSYENPNRAAEEMKRLCYERGAEDNLTAVIVQVGAPAFQAIDAEETISTTRPEMTPTEPLPPAPAPAAPAITQLTPASRIAFPATNVTAEGAAVINGGSAAAQGGRTMLRIFVFLLFLAVAAGAFYGGMRFQMFRAGSSITAPSANSAAATQENDRATAFDRKRDAVDSDPQKWIGENVLLEMAKEGIGKPAESKDPEFLYLYGRALMLTGNHHDAMQAFDQAISNLPADSKGQLPLDVQIRLGSVSATMKTKPKTPTQEALLAEQKAMRILDELLSIKSEAR